MNSREISPAHIAGLVVGEGCFYVESAPDPKYKSGWRLRPAFCIEMRADDAPVLEEVRRQLGCGRVYELIFGRYQGYERKNWHPHAKFRVTRIDDLRTKVIPFFRAAGLFGRKKEVFEVFATLVQMLAEGRHRHPETFCEVRDVADQLKDLNARGLANEGRAHLAKAVRVDQVQNPVGED
jgi:hypothetical protein